MTPPRQVSWTKAFWVVVCAGSFYAVCANAGQFHRAPLPNSPRRNSMSDLSSRERMMRGINPERATRTPRERRTNSKEVTCTVLGWRPVPAPTLDLTCPPTGTLSPVHLYLRMSWESPENVPTRAEDVVARPNIPAKVRIPAQAKATNAGAAVKLPTRHNGHGKEREQWFIFNQVAVALAAD